VAVDISSYSLTDEMERVRSRLQGGRSVDFGELFQQAESRLHAVVIFLALLELIRLGEAGVRQRSTFGDIEVTPAGA
jgi:segregation and condensation protein A